MSWLFPHLLLLYFFYIIHSACSMLLSWTIVSFFLSFFLSFAPFHSQSQTLFFKLFTRCFKLCSPWTFFCSLIFSKLFFWSRLLSSQSTNLDTWDCCGLDTLWQRLPCREFLDWSLQRGDASVSSLIWFDYDDCWASIPDTLTEIITLTFRLREFVSLKSQC